MKRAVTTASVLALSLLALSPVNAQSWTQLAASAGLTPKQAEGLTLAQIAAFHVDRGASVQDRQAIPGWIAPVDTTAAAGNIVQGFEMSARNMPGLTLAEIAAIEFEPWRELRRPPDRDATDTRRRQRPQPARRCGGPGARRGGGPQRHRDRSDAFQSRRV